MIDDAEAAAGLARSLLAGIARDEEERYERAGDRLHELKPEITAARARFRREVAVAHRDVFERELHTWARRSKRGPPARAKASARADTPARSVSQAEEPRRKASDDRPSLRVVLVIGGCVFTTFSIAGIVAERRERAERRDDSHAGHEVAHATGTTGALGPVKLPSCDCMSDHDNPPTEVMLLAPPTDYSQPWSVDIRRAFGPLSRFRFPEQPGAALEPQMRSVAPYMGLACDENVFVVLVKDQATAWSSVDATWKWNAALPEPLSPKGVSTPAPLVGSAIRTMCVPLEIRAGAVVVPLASGATAKLSVIDGQAP
jgi:hypothetical protein